MSSRWAEYPRAPHWNCPRKCTSPNVTAWNPNAHIQMLIWQLGRDNNYHRDDCVILAWAYEDVPKTMREKVNHSS
jgi:hypothetical protein